ncbi:MAG: S-layer homology domain-containing protein [Actinomycetota bacterium]
MSRASVARGVIIALFAAMLATTPVGAAAGFVDVANNAYYADAVQWMVDQGITSGKQPNRFEPDAPATRAEVAVFFHRMEGADAVASTTSFRDVDSDAFYADAVAWMVDQGITKGTSATTFSPDRFITRAEIAVFLHRLADLPPGAAEPFADVEEGDYFLDAVAWMVDRGITSGTTPTSFSPHRSVTRAEIAAFLYRYQGSPAVTVDQSRTPDVDPALLEAADRSLTLLNDMRREAGLGPLASDPDLDAIARAWSADLHRRDVLEHSNGNYGENIGWWSNAAGAPTAAADLMHGLWADSGPHRANMLGSGYTRIGIGFFRGENGWYATHVFS